MKDYKFFCFNGEAKFLYVSESLSHKLAFLNLDWTPSDFCRDDYIPLTDIPPKPDNLDEMIEVVNKLAKGKPHVRVDLYDVYGHLFFGEITLYTASGFIPFNPKEIDKKIGEMIILPKENRKV